MRSEPLYRRAAAVVARRGSATTAEIAAELHATPRAVASALCWARGAGLVNDGTINEDLGGGLMGHTSPPGPTVWSAR